MNATKPKKQRKPRPVKLIEHEMTISGALAAFGELETLAQEMRDWADNMEDNFSSTQKYSEVSDAADTLENLTEPTCPDELEGDKFSFKYQTIFIAPSRRRTSRSARRDDATQDLTRLVEFLETFEDSKEYSDEEKAAATQLMGEVQAVIDEAEGVEFPGMFG